MAVDIHKFLSDQAQSIQTPSLRQITLRVQAVQGINLGQGVCQLPVPAEVLNAAHRALDTEFNRYTSPRGLLSLREAVAQKLAKHNGLTVSGEHEVLITHGTTGAFEGVCATLINPGDRVVNFSPYYPYHHNTLSRFGAEIAYVTLSPPDWQINWQEFDAAFSEPVKFVLVNTPANPTGKVFRRDEIERIGAACIKHGALLVTDEIYEYMTFDGAEHVSPASLPGLAERTITIGGYSKTFAITGWRIGYLSASRTLCDELVGMLDSIYVCPPAPLQQGVAEALSELSESFYDGLRSMYQEKRNFFSGALANAGLTAIKPQGAYYLMASYDNLSPELSSREFVDRMISETKVGAVPADDFVLDSTEHRWVRFCVALPDEQLERAAQQLSKLGSI